LRKYYLLPILRTKKFDRNFGLEENKTYEVPAYKTTAVDTNGAGDMFAGGVIHGLSEGWENDKSARFGNFLASKGVAEIGPRLKKNKYIEYLNEFFKK